MALSSSYVLLKIKLLKRVDSFHVACALAIICGLYSNQFWFLIMLFSVMLAAAFSSVLNRKMMPVRIQPYSLLVIAFIVSLCFNFFHDKTSDFILYFFIGYYLSIVDVFKFKFVNNKFTSLLFLFLGLLLLECFDKSMMNFWDFHFLEFLTIKPFYLYILRHICALCICAFFVLIFRSFNVKYTIFSFMGTLTLPLYMVHAFTISIFKMLHIHLQLNDWQYMCYAIPTTIIWVIICSFMILYTLRYKVIRKVYWGMA